MDIARVAGVSINTISRYELGEGFPSSVEISALATFFKVSVEDLIGGDLVSRFPDAAGYQAYRAEAEQESRRTEVALEAIRMAPYRLQALLEAHAAMVEASTGKPAAETLKALEARARKLSKEIGR